MAKTKINWAERVWNPTVGCRRVSEGCRNCYAERFARRLAAMGRPEYQGLLTDDGRWNGTVRTLPERLEDPLRWKKPARIFVDSMSDLFHEHVPVSFIAAVYETMASWRLVCRKQNCDHGPECYEDPGHTYLILTKRPRRMKSILTDELPEYVANYYPGDSALSSAMEAGDWPLKNIWLGVSVENQEAADKRIPLLLETPAVVRFVSCEPLLGEVDLSPYLNFEWYADNEHPISWGKGDIVDREIHPHKGYPARLRPAISWVIVGGESGPGARPMAYEWVDSILDQCLSAGVRFFFKQWGEWFPSPFQGSKIDHGGYPYDPKTNTIRIGKKKAGRILDGRTWDQYPNELEGEK